MPRVPSSERQPLLRLPRPPVRVARHLRPQADQHLLDSGVAIPVLGGGDAIRHDLPRVAIDAVHDDAADEADPGGHGGVGLGDGDAELVEAGVVHGLRPGGGLCFWFGCGTTK